jgi:hypothetical protein
MSKSSVVFVGDTECLGCPLVIRMYENVDQVKELVFENIRVTIHKVSNMLGI